MLKKEKQLNRDIRAIDTIIIHCSASDIPAHDDVSVIRNWHLKRGFIDVGYHFFIKQSNGIVQTGRPLYQVGAHCEHFNEASIGICLSGEHNFTKDQYYSTWQLCRNLCQQFKINKPNILPHNWFNHFKSCPNFSLDKLWQFDDVTDPWYIPKLRQC